MSRRPGATKQGRSSPRAPAPARHSVGVQALKRQATSTRQRAARTRDVAVRRKIRVPVRDTLRRVPRAAWLCAAVACLSALAWSIVMPPLQVPDEPEHVAYVKQLVEAHSLPSASGNFSYEEQIALAGTRLQEVAEQPENHTIATRAENQALQNALATAAKAPRTGSHFAGVAASQPPLYYALQAVPYVIGSGGTLLDRIQLMRLFSALFAGLTALFGYLFIREALPRTPWAWTVGGMGVALVPLLGLMSGAINPDSMLFAVSAALFYVLARTFRRGFTRRSAVALGALTAIGFMTKLNFVGLAPGVLGGMIVLAVRAARVSPRDAYRSLAIGLAIGLSPVVLYVAAHLASGGSTFGIVSVTTGSFRGSVFDQLSYIWQLYLPRLPGMHDDFGGLFTTRQLWFDGYVGQFGWFDTPFPGWVDTLALIPAFAIVGLFVRELVLRIGALRGRLVELAVYCLMAVGLLMLIGASSYTRFPTIDAEYAQVRYLLPLLPLFGAMLALAARGAGRRWGPAAGVLIVMLFVTHDILGQLQTVARYYG